MRYEIGKVRTAIIDDKGVHITEKGQSRFIPFGQIVAVAVKKPGAIAAGHIFFQTASDGTNPLASRNTVPFRDKESYTLALEIQAEVEKVIA